MRAGFQITDFKSRHAQLKAQPKKRLRRITGLRRGTGFYCIYCRFTGSVYDFVNFVTGHELGETYAKMTFSRLTKEGHEHAKEVVTNCYYFQFPGQGQKSTPCMTLRGLQRLLMILGGKVAAEFREIVEYPSRPVGDLKYVCACLI